MSRFIHRSNFLDVSRLTAHGSRLTAHGSRLTAHGSLLEATLLSIKFKYTSKVYTPLNMDASHSDSVPLFNFSYL